MQRSPCILANIPKLTVDGSVKIKRTVFSVVWDLALMAEATKPLFAFPSASIMSIVLGSVSDFAATR